ncbi:hypothetical protein CUPS9163_08390 [Campylobacter upsaliensis]|uniref:hypothetical protein n=1 Tax=Campylobacter upsaliensis TaxID=28080 RepID=UPI00214A8106|nr:hypothetical protein [Campylobacter upsaliensis]MCR2092323.1 hypothetical protein [Campylobacter upsaliensis]MCR2119527.1 hypothetical protein [Campylobacter upsaliensis]MEB2809558.1 hypothetical protein [Campylobacter upsaliensis]MEB2828882.1 hypothetical protein [Campylobacter upsaliensis]
MALASEKFEFKAFNFDNLEGSLDYKISSQSRLNHHNALFASFKHCKKLKI